ncbi:hypothetical protein CR513_55934, partial [Mucuna pruriens]
MGTHSLSCNDGAHVRSWLYGASSELQTRPCFCCQKLLDYMQTDTSSSVQLLTQARILHILLDRVWKQLDLELVIEKDHFVIQVSIGSLLVSLHQ